MAGREGGNKYIAHLHGAAGFYVSIVGAGGYVAQFLGHVARAIDAELIFFGKLPEPANVVRMLVRVENARKLSNTKPAFLQSLANAGSADTGVNQQMGIATGYNGGISLATAGEYRKSHENYCSTYSMGL